MTDGTEAIPPPPVPVKCNDPALFLTVQSTLPRLTTTLFSFALAAIGYSISSNSLGDANWIETTVIGSEFVVTSKSIAQVLITTAAMCFLVSTEGCVKTHGWDYHAVGDARSKAFGISSDPEYIDDCVKATRATFRTTVIALRSGITLLLLGIGVLFYPATKTVPIVVGIFLVVRTFKWLYELSVLRSHAKLRSGGAG